MNSSNDEELERIKKKIVKTQIMGFPGWILIGLGLFGLYGSPTDGNAFFSLLADKNVATSLLILGLAIGLLEAFIMIRLYKKKARIVRDHDAEQ